jgi:hypothetical protein
MHNPADPWRRNRAEQEGCERLLAVALDQVVAVDPITRAAILADAALTGGKLIDLIAAAYQRGLEGEVDHARRELRLLRDRGNLRRRLASVLDLYADELGAQQWVAMVDRLVLELVELVAGTEEAVRRQIADRGRRERRVVESVGRA